MAQEHITIDGSHVSIEQVASFAYGECRSQLSNSVAFQAHIDSGHHLVKQLLNSNQRIYGLTTGFGHSIAQSIEPEDSTRLQENLVRYHGCGLGNYFDTETTRAILLTRLVSLSKGYSGVSYALLEALDALIRHDILPLIPSEGSVGASGDLTPLSYIAAALMGERDVRYQGNIMSARDALAICKLDSYQLKPKEALALMNGTSVMTALAALAYSRSRTLLNTATRVSAMACRALDGKPEQFHPDLFKVKPHPGQIKVANQAYHYLIQSYPDHDGSELQCAYSIRCAPHVLGCLADALDHYQSVIEIELNSSNDNPIVDVETGRIHHGGHFYGGHIAMVMDGLKTLVANVADLIDRQIALVLDTRFNNGLPLNLSVSPNSEPFHHGFKAVQITVSACTAEALKLTMPASVFSRSTECHNQDKVSMGTIAARDTIRILELTEQCLAAGYLVAAHASYIRNNLLNAEQPKHLKAFIDEHPLLNEDRVLEGELRNLTHQIRQNDLSL